MTPDQWNEVKDRFHEALLVEDEGARQAFLTGVCSDDVVRREVESLLAEHAHAGKFLSQPIFAEEDLIDSETWAMAAKRFASELTRAANDTIGPYRLVERIGEGGMGEVWLAEQTFPVRRRVALKLIKAGMGSHEVITRFESERQALALMDHPAVAKVFDGGSTSQGQPYFVMEYVHGGAITDRCDQLKLTIPERLDLFVRVCEGVNHAHQKGVIHRDLKPSNILVMEVDDKPTPKIIDFGVAKALSQKLSEDTLLTRVGMILGTQEYMSPEQANSAGADIDTRTDVYSLGVILYQLLVGAPPLELRHVTFEEILRRVREDDPPRPSTKLRTLGEQLKVICSNRLAEPKLLLRLLRGDLDSIVMKALEKQREHRYGGPAELATDIGRYLRHEPVLARPQSVSYRTGKFVRRHRWAVIAVASIAFALTAGLSAALWEAHLARTQAQVANREAQTSAAVEQFITEIFETNSRNQTDPFKARQTSARQLLDIGANKIETSLMSAPAAKERMLEILANLYLELGLDDQAVAFSQKRVAAARTLYGANNPKVASALCQLAASMQSSRSVNGRETVLLEAKSILDSNHDFSSSDRGTLLNALAEHYTSIDARKALDFASQAVDLFRRTPPSGGLSQALCYQGAIYGFSGDHAKAEASFAESVSVAQKVGGEAAADLPVMEVSLAEQNSELMHYDDALENFGLAFRTAKAKNGEDHVAVIETEARFGQFLSMISQHTEALPHLKRALDNCLKLKGPDDPFYTPQMLLLYGEALGDSGHLEEGLAAISQAVENRRKNRPGTRYLAQMLCSQAWVLLDLGEYEKAQRSLEEAAAISKIARFKLSNEYAGARLKLAFDLKKSDDASAIIERSYGPVADNVPLSLGMLSNLTARAQLALAKNDAPSALSLAGRLSAAVISNPSRKYLKIWEERAALAEGKAYLKENRTSEALPHLQRAAQLDAEMYDPTSAELIPSRAALATTFLKSRNRDKALKLFAQAESIHRYHPHLGERFEAPLRELRESLRVKGRSTTQLNNLSNVGSQPSAN